MGVCGGSSGCRASKNESQSSTEKPLSVRSLTDSVTCTRKTCLLTGIFTHAGHETRPSRHRRCNKVNADIEIGGLGEGNAACEVAGPPDPGERHPPALRHPRHPLRVVVDLQDEGRAEWEVSTSEKYLHLLDGGQIDDATAGAWEIEPFQLQPRLAQTDKLILVQRLRHPFFPSSQTPQRAVVGGVDKKTDA